MVGDEAAEEEASETEEEKLPVRGTRSLAEVYERWNLATLEPTNFIEAAKSEAWRVPMREELAMIEKKSDLEACGQTKG